MLKISRTRRAQSNLDRNGKSIPSKPTEKFGIKIPKNMKEALLFDKENNNTKWSDAVSKEMNGLKKLNCFKFHPPHKVFKNVMDGSMLLSI